MARKRRRSSKSGVSGVMVLGAIMIGLLASIPKGVWVVLVGVAIIGMGGWLIIKAFSKPPTTTTSTVHSSAMKSSAWYAMANHLEHCQSPGH